METLVSHASPRVRPRRFRIRALVALVFVLLVVAGAYPLVSGRTEPSPGGVGSARAALQRARREGAARWAPVALQDAEITVRAALLEHRSQELRFVLLRDFRRARALLSRAEAKGEGAAQSAAAARRDAGVRAEAAIARARSALATSSAFARAMHLRPAERRRFQGARIALLEAQILHRDGDFAAAGGAAERALAASLTLTARATSAASRFSDAALVRRWRQWIDDTVAGSRRSGRTALVVYKDAHVMTLYRAGKPVRTYPVDLGYNSVPDKRLAGDGATPEGRYRITVKKDRGRSIYYKALLLDYPNDEDRAEFRRDRSRGAVPPRASLGGLIEIHGEGGRGRDWTKGCVAVTNREMDDLFGRVEVGTPVTIVGGDGRGGRLAGLLDRHRSMMPAGTD